jgi:exosome complex component RRP46
VHGPIAPRQAQHENSDACTVSVVIKGDVQGYEREWEAFLTEQLKACILTNKYRRCVVSVILQVMNADGSVLAACLHASIAALMDGCIEMKLLPTAVTCRIMKNTNEDGYIQLDPNAEEEQEADAVIVVVLPNHATADRCFMLGCFTTASMNQSVDKILNCCRTAARAVPAVQAFLRLVVEQKVTRESQTLWSS